MHPEHALLLLLVFGGLLGAAHLILWLYDKIKEQFNNVDPEL
jgi:hypothetical protein